MSGQVRVESVDALKKFRAALCKFAETTAVSLDEAETEIQRTRYWVQQDQHAYWKRQIRKRTELYTRAKSALNRKKLMKTPLGGRYSCIEEEKALAVAERHLEEAQQKMENVRHWRRGLDDESESYQAVAQGLSVAIQAEIPTALAQLDNMIAALEAYATSTAPAEQRSAARAGTEETVAGLEAGASMARGAPPPTGGVMEEYGRLRTQTPSQIIREETPISEPTFEWPAPQTVADTLPTTLAALDTASQPPTPESKVVLAHGVWERQRIYLERMKTDSPNDSGWYIGVADDTQVSDYDAVRIADLLARRPDLDAVLQLPVGYLVVLDGGALAAVFDPGGTALWVAAGRSGDTR
jgi:hypothetical protein